MTNTPEKGPVWLKDCIETELPEAHVQLFKPGGKPKADGWMLDVTYPVPRHPERFVNIMWTKSKGFGISTPDEDEAYGLPPDEWFTDADDACARVLHLLNTGEKTHPRRELRLKELRARRELSQEALAATMKMTQGAVSQVENQPNPNLSTLQSFVEALGGRLRVYAEFPGEESIELALPNSKKPSNKHP